jgi:hypothetical protein
MNQGDLRAMRLVLLKLAREAEAHFETFPLTRRSEQTEEYQVAFRLMWILTEGAEAIEYLLMERIPPMSSFYVYGHSSDSDYGTVDEEELLNRLYIALAVIF